MNRNFVGYISLLILLFGFVPAAVTAAPAAPTGVNTWDVSDDFVVDTPTLVHISEILDEIADNGGIPENSVILTKPKNWGPQGAPFGVGTEVSEDPNDEQWLCYPTELCGDFVGHIHTPYIIGVVEVEDGITTYVVVSVLDNDIDDRQVYLRVVDENQNVLEEHVLPQGMTLNAYVIQIEHSGAVIVVPEDSVGVVVAKITETAPQLPTPEYTIDMGCDSMSATISSGRLVAQSYVNGELFIDFDIQAQAGAAIGSAWMFQPPLEGNLVVTATGTLYDVLGQPVNSVEWSKQLSCPIIPPPPTPEPTPEPEPEPYLTHEFVCPTEATAGWFVGNGELFGMDLSPWGYQEAFFNLWYRASETEVWSLVESAGFNTANPINFHRDVTEYGLYSWSVMAGEMSANGLATCTAPTAIDDDAPEPVPTSSEIFLPLVVR